MPGSPVEHQRDAPGRHSDKPSLHDVRQHAVDCEVQPARICFLCGRDWQPKQDWWSQTGSNRRPHACKARALPTELWPRIQDLARSLKMVGPGRVELPTSRLSGVRSNHLSYGPPLQVTEDGRQRTDKNLHLSSVV